MFINISQSIEKLRDITNLQRTSYDVLQTYCKKITKLNT